MNSPKPTSAHTAGRLTVSQGTDHRAYYLLSSGKCIARIPGGPEAEANAARLALAWNSHDELVAALRAILTQCDGDLSNEQLGGYLRDVLAQDARSVLEVVQ